VDYCILLGSFGWFFMWFLLFIRQLPVMALAEIKEIIPPKMRQRASDAERIHDLNSLTLDPTNTAGDD
jgi:molybdopterin-containing oxidoreductase family membrane subunit